MKDKLLKFTQKHSELWKFIKFTFTGASTSVLELAVFMFLQYCVFKSLNEVPVKDNTVMNFLGIDKNKKRNIVDTISAVYILETYINSNKQKI